MISCMKNHKSSLGFCGFLSQCIACVIQGKYKEFKYGEWFKDESLIKKSIALECRRGFGKIQSYIINYRNLFCKFVFIIKGSLKKPLLYSTYIRNPNKLESEVYE